MAKPLSREKQMDLEREENLQISRLNDQVNRLESVADFGRFYIFFTIGMFVLGIAVNIMVLNKKLGG